MPTTIGSFIQRHSAPERTVGLSATTPALCLVIVILGMILTPCWAQNGRSQGPRMLALDSPVYVLMRRLYVEEGLVFPSQTFPWSVEEAHSYLDRLTVTGLSAAGRRAIREIQGHLESDPLTTRENGSLAFDISPEISLETYFHLGDRDDPDIDRSDDVVYPDDEVWEHGYDDRLALLVLPLELTLFDRVYAAMDIDIRLEPKIGLVFPDRVANVPIDIYDLYIHTPFRAFLSTGGPHWALQFGRDTLSWGSGVGGNLVLSDFADYHDVFRVTTFWRGFKATAAYVVLEPWLTAEEASGDDEAEEYKAFFAHRFEFRIRDRVNITVTESVIQGRKYPSLPSFNPLMWFHNSYQNTYNNILFTVETDVAVLPGLAAYAQGSLYQWQTPTEKATYAGADGEPDAFAFLLGLEGLLPMGSGFVEGGLEWVYTSPWMYTLRFGSPLLSYTSRRDINSRNGYNLERPLGYRYGPDADTKTLRLGYRVPGAWASGLTVEYRLKGELSITDPYPDNYPYFRDTDPDSELADQYADPTGARTPTGEHPERKWVVGVSGEVTPIDFLTTGGSLAWIRTRNRGARQGSPENDVEVTAFVTAHY